MVTLGIIDTAVAPAPCTSARPDCGGRPPAFPSRPTRVTWHPDGSFEVSIQHPVPHTGDDRQHRRHRGMDPPATGTIRLFGTPAGGLTPARLSSRSSPTASPTPSWITNCPMQQSVSSRAAGHRQFSRLQAGRSVRVIVISATKERPGLVAVADRPFMQFGPGRGPNMPSPASLQIAQDMGKYVTASVGAGTPGLAGCRVRHSNTV